MDGERCVCPDNFHVSFGTFLLGLILGLISPSIIVRMLSMASKFRNTSLQVMHSGEKEDLSDHQTSMMNLTNSNDDSVSDIKDETLRNKLRWRKGIIPVQGLNSAFTKGNLALSKISASFSRSMISIRGALFANSMRKLSSISGRQCGLIEARGKVGFFALF